MLQNTNRGRWPIIGLDLGNKPVTKFSKHNTDNEETTSPHLQPILHPEQEGLQDDKPDTMEPTHTILEYILRAQKDLHTTNRTSSERLVTHLGPAVNSSETLPTKEKTTPTRRMQVLRWRKHARKYKPHPHHLRAA